MDPDKRDPHQTGKCGICQRCGGVYWGDCSCHPYQTAILEWDVGCEWEAGKRVPGSEHLDYGTVYARSEEQAAERAYEQRDDEPDCAEKHVAVISPGRDKPVVYQVTAEATIDYNAHAMPGLGKFTFEACQAADLCGIDIPDAQRPHTRLGNDYYERTAKA